MKSRGEAVLLLGGMFSEQQSAIEYGKKLLLELRKMEKRQPGKGVWHPYQFHQSRRLAWNLTAQSAGN